MLKRTLCLAGLALVALFVIMSASQAFACTGDCEIETITPTTDFYKVAGVATQTPDDAATLQAGTPQATPQPTATPAPIIKSQVPGCLEAMIISFLLVACVVGFPIWHSRRMVRARV